MFKRIALLAAMIFVPLGTVLTVGVPAASASAANQVCAQSGNGYCLNAWGGFFLNAPIKMYYNDHTDNNNFEGILTNRCGGDYVVFNQKTNSGCPFNDPNLDKEFQGAPIVQYVGTAGCIGLQANTHLAALTNCNTTGTADVQNETDSGTCPVGSTNIVSVFWSNENGRVSFLESGGAIDVQAPYVDSGNFSCWNIN